MTSRGLVATVKAPEAQILAYIAHHLALGAARIWLYFDDPADPAYARISRLPRVKAVRCTDWYWAWRGGRPEKLHNRQIRNARHAQRGCRLTWLGHLDVDEFIHAPRPVAELLADVPPEVPNVLMDAFEAMHDPSLPDDIFTGRHFRGPLRTPEAALHKAVFGPSAPLLAKGNLGHTIGKSFRRMAARDVFLGLHEVFRDGRNLAVPFHPSLRILHFHAQDPEVWRRVLPFRLQNGAYHFPAERVLHDFLAQADDAALRAFYADTMTLTAGKLALLQATDRLITADLTLRAKVQDLLAGRI